MARKAKEPKKEVVTDVLPSNEPKIDPALRALAISHRDKYAQLKNRLGDAQSDMRLFTKEVKEDGFTLRQIKLMHELSTPEGEAAFRMTVANDLIAVQYQGAEIGQQLALFLEPNRTTAVDIAYDEGQRDSMEGKPPKPLYAPSTAQFQRYLDGFHDHNGKTAMAGIKPTGGYIPMTAEELTNQQTEAKRATHE